MTELALYVAQVGIRHGIVVVIDAVVKRTELLVGEQWRRRCERVLVLRAAARRTVE